MLLKFLIQNCIYSILNKAVKQIQDIFSPDQDLTSDKNRKPLAPKNYRYVELHHIHN